MVVRHVPILRDLRRSGVQTAQMPSQTLLPFSRSGQQSRISIEDLSVNPKEGTHWLKKSDPSSVSPLRHPAETEGACEDLEGCYVVNILSIAITTLP